MFFASEIQDTIIAALADAEATMVIAKKT